MKKIIVNGKPCTPSKVVCVGRNYAAHISELGNETPTEMVLFTKPNSAISESLNSFDGEPLHYEAEICFIYENGGFTAVGFGLDLTKRALQSRLKEKGLPWERAKAFNGSALFSEFIPVQGKDELSIQLDINNELRQKGDVSLMLYKPDEILKEITSFMTLENGDIVMTGTPKGVGIINSGDQFTGSIAVNGKQVIDVSWIAE